MERTSGQLAGRVAIVTGSGRGIGRAIAQAYAAEGAALMLVDRDETAVREVADALRRGGWQAQAAALDVTDEDAVNSMVKRTADELGPPTVLVNNAGICPAWTVSEMTLAQWREVLEVNLTSVFLCSRAVLPSMIAEGGGAIINIGSQLATRGSELMVAYCASKSGVHGFTRALAREMAPHNVTVNTIAPGPTDTELLRADPPEWLEQKLAELPLGRFARPEEIAPSAVLLASAGGAYYTGATLNVSGGDVM
jgi:3-oxoacyl-[acyl-carrier protein] reductase